MDRMGTASLHGESSVRGAASKTGEAQYSAAYIVSCGIGLRNGSACLLCFSAFVAWSLQSMNGLGIARVATDRSDITRSVVSPPEISSPCSYLYDSPPTMPGAPESKRELWIFSSELHPCEHLSGVAVAASPTEARENHPWNVSTFFVRSLSLPVRLPVRRWRQRPWRR